MKQAGRLHGLDALRGFAALWVVVYHDTLRYPRFMRGLEMDTPLVPGMQQAELGIMPVLWFFIISGFVIALTLDRCRTPMDFVVSRVSRIYPAYWAAIVLITVLSSLWPLPGVHLTVTHVLVNATMLQAYLGVPNLDGVFWSLAVELLFYVYTLGFFMAGARRHVHVAVLVWAVAGLSAAVAVGSGGAVSWRLNQMLLLQYGPLLVAGMMVYRLWRGTRPGWSAATLAVCAAAVAVGQHPVTAATCFVMAGLIGWSARGGAAWLATPPLPWLGSISYALYLSHETTSFTVIAALDAAGIPHAGAIPAGIAAALGVAVLITYGIEQPALRALRTGWRAVKRAPASPAVGAASGAPPGPPAARG